jgi:hypothetical protein
LVSEWWSVSPVPRAAEMISVESISPTTIRAVCALRRGMLRTPSLKMTGRRHATQATEAEAEREQRHKGDEDAGHGNAEEVVHGRGLLVR